MRLLLMVLLLGGSSISSFAQSLQIAGAMAQAQHTVSPLFVKYEGRGAYTIPRPPGLRMRNVGRTLTIVGSALLVGGVAVLSSAEDETYYTSYGGYTTYYEEIDPKWGIGTAMIAGGIGMIVPGIIFWTKGAKKYNRYLERQEASFNFNGSGLSVQYRF